MSERISFASMPAKDGDYGSIAIVGVGLIGGSLAMALRRAGHDGEIVGVSGPTTIREALERRVIDRGASYGDLVDVASSVDLVVLATPIRAILEHLETLGRAGASLRDGLVVTDVGSTMATILERAARTLPDRVHFIGGHPMAGSERRGLAAADPFLFQNAYYVLTPARGVPVAQVTRLERLLSRTGARVMVLDAADHDRTAASVSHVPQLLAVALVNFIDDHPDDRDVALRLAAGGFRDMTRIAASPFTMWRDIYATNSKEVREAVERFCNRLKELAALVGDERLGALFDHAATTRATIPRDSKGFLRPLWEVLVEVEDRPGIISTIASTLADAKINIKDIEVVKVREDEGGTLRLAFSTEEVAREAIELLAGVGFTARLRD